MSGWTICVCSRCGVPVEWVEDEMVPVDECGDAERRCGVYTQATAISTGPVNDVPGVREVQVVPATEETT